MELAGETSREAIKKGIYEGMDLVDGDRGNLVFLRNYGPYLWMGPLAEVLVLGDFLLLYYRKHLALCSVG